MTRKQGQATTAPFDRPAAPSAPSMAVPSMAAPSMAVPSMAAPSMAVPTAAPVAAPPRIHPEGRPHAVPGPLGTPLTLETLPPPGTQRWVVRRKAEVLAAINGGLLTAAEACARYRLSPEELELWQDAVDRAGVPGLRVTRIQIYRDRDCRRQASHRRASSGSVAHR